MRRIDFGLAVLLPLLASFAPAGALALTPDPHRTLRIERVELTDNGDDDGWADTRETVTMRLTIRNRTGIDLTNVVARLSTDDPKIDCVLDPVLRFGDLAAGEAREPAGGFVFLVADVGRASTDQAFSVTFEVWLTSLEIPEPDAALPVTIDLDLDVSGGGDPTTFFEGFESGFGAFTTMHIDQELNPPDSDLANRPAGVANADGYRCQYSDPDWEGSRSFGTSSGAQCFPNPNGAADAFYFHAVTDRAHSGAQSMGYNIFLDVARGWTTPNSQLEAIRTNEPVSLDWARRCSVTASVACDDAFDCPVGEACRFASPTLSFRHQISLVDHRSRGAQPGRTADRAVVHVQLADASGAPVGAWIKAQPFVNLYDSQANSNYYNCSFDPIDDGNTEEDFFDPADPLRRFGPSSTCLPEYSFAHQGDTDTPFDPEGLGDAPDGPGLEGSVGTGTWVEPVFDLSRFRGRRIRLRFLQTGLKLGGTINWEQTINFNPDPGDDGWFIDDVQVTRALTTPAGVDVDAKDNAHLPGSGDDDGDGVFCDNCPETFNPDQADSDLDRIGDACDDCPTDALNDVDFDGWCCPEDNCCLGPNVSQTDFDLDGSGDACDSCPATFDPDQSDRDGDGTGDVCDSCPDDPVDSPDGDLDGVGDACDNCPFHFNAEQPDRDGDAVGDDCDNCVSRFNPRQTAAFGLSEDPLFDGPVEAFALSPAGDRVVFLQEPEPYGKAKLFSAPLDGGPATRLDVAGAPVAVADFRVSPDGASVVYVAAIDSGGLDVFQVPAAGGPSTRLNPVLPPGSGVSRFRISPDSQTVVYLADQDQDDVVELFGVPLGGGMAFKLNELLGESQDVLDFEISPDSARVVYRSGQLAGETAELFSVAIGGGPAMKLSGPTETGGGVLAFAIDPSASRVVFRARHDTNTPPNVFSSPITGGTPAALSSFTATFTGVDTFVISPDGLSVVYLTPPAPFGPKQLFSVPIDGGQPVPLNPPLPSGGLIVGRFVVTPDSQRVVYAAEQEVNDRVELYSVALGGGASTRLSGLMPPAGDVFNATLIYGSILVDWRHLVTPDGSTVLYASDQDAPDSDRPELFAVPATGGTPVKLNGPLTPGGHVAMFQIAPDSQAVVYSADQNVEDALELFHVSIDGSDLRPLSGPLAPGVAELEFDVNDGVTVVYRAAQYTFRRERVLAVRTTDADPDGDGAWWICDCDETRSVVYAGAPEINDGLDNQCPGDAGHGLVDETGSGSRFDRLVSSGRYYWPAQPGATSYEVARAAEPTFAGCTVFVTAEPAVEDPQVPPEGQALFYLNRALAPKAGSWGAASSGQERTGLCPIGPL